MGAVAALPVDSVEVESESHLGTVIVCPAHRLAQAKHAPNAPTARAIAP